ncbi:MAG: 4'-phosphopantetheinyl transferase superfamily protein [Prevotellaceae bacterium]|jgi:phosphopantetheinyl transferase|nr:4'-phosphopantetheinyl transferase superfamily protein [Prevotellaceae bacterium]
MAVFSITRHKCGSVVAVWKIEEPEEELRQLCAIPHNELEEMNYISSPQRRIERLAVRVLLNKVLGEKVYLGYHDNGRPFLQNNVANISITHTQRFAAIVYNPLLDVGVDMESLARNFTAVEQKALSDKERDYLSDKHRHTQLCLIWCAKEAIYKRFSDNGVDFATQMYIEKFTPKKEGKLTATYIDSEGEETVLTPHYELIEDHMLVWVSL